MTDPVSKITDLDFWSIRRTAFKAAWNGEHLSEMPDGLSVAQQDVWFDGWTDGDWSRYATT